MDIISKAYAEGAAPSGGSGYEMIIMLAVFGFIFYFMIFRPQSKRAKEHKNLMSSLSKGDEVLTLNDQTQITIKKDYVTAVLPKGTIQSL